MAPLCQYRVHNPPRTLGRFQGHEAALHGFRVVRVPSVPELVCRDVYLEPCGWMLKEPMHAHHAALAAPPEPVWNAHRLVAVFLAPKVVQGFGCHIAASPGRNGIFRSESEVFAFDKVRSKLRPNPEHDFRGFHIGLILPHQGILIFSKFLSF
jgi:hypothetical protein